MVEEGGVASHAVVFAKLKEMFEMPPLTFAGEVLLIQRVASLIHCVVVSSMPVATVSTLGSKMMSSGGS